MVFSLILSLLLISTVFSGCKSTEKNSSVVKVKFNEVARSVFYAPMYAAISEGFFKEEGLELDISTGQGADKTMQQVLSGTDEIGFCGPEQAIYIYNQKRDNYPIVFAQLTQTDGSFLIGRKNEPNFKWENLKGKNIIGGRPGGIPEMALEYVLKNHGLVPGKDVNMVTNIDYTATAGAFKGGTGDYVALFEPTGSVLQRDNSGYIVASVGASAGTIPYTCFFATKSYINKHPDIIEKFTRAIYKGQIWITKKTDTEVATSIKSFFPGTDVSLLANVVKNYRSINAYAPNPTLKQADYERFMDIIQSYDKNLIKERPPFDKIITNKYADEAVKSIK